MGPSASFVTAPEERWENPWLGEVLETIAEFGQASIEFVAWELCLPDYALVPAWRQALAERLIEEAGPCRETSEIEYRLVSARSDRLRSRSRPVPAPAGAA